TPTLISLPAYQSIFEGKLTDCDSNDCAAASAETFPERIARELKLAPGDVAAFASWNRIERAFGSHVLVDAGMHDGDEPAPPWSRARYDRATWAKATRYLTEKRPRFLYISFDDADEWAHDGNK